MKKLMFVLAVFILAANVSMAVTTTNALGQIVTVSTLSEEMAASVAVADLSVYPKKVGEYGMAVAHCKITASTSGSVVLSVQNLPKGAILLENAVIEVTTAITPATSTNTVTVGGVTALATGVTLNATGIKQAVATPAITTSAGKVTLAITGDPATAGEFTVYLPFVLGTAQ